MDNEPDADRRPGGIGAAYGAAGQSASPANTAGQDGAERRADAGNQEHAERRADALSDLQRGAAAGAPRRGADLARDALAQARARSAARRKAAGRPAIRLRGSRSRWSGAGPDPARDPQPFGSLAANWVRRTADPADLAKATVVSRWEQIVGPAVAAHCRPVSLVDGVLTVQADSTAWATQIRALAPALLAKLAAAAGANQVRQLRAHGPAGPSWRFGNRHVSGRGPRDTYG